MATMVPDALKELADHLESGKVREALGLVSVEAFKSGVAHGPSLQASRKMSNDSLEIILAHCEAQKKYRKQMMQILRGSTAVKIDGTLHLASLSKADAEAALRSWPFRAKRGRPRKSGK